MKTWQGAAVAALLAFPALVTGQETQSDDAIEEIVVHGRAVTTATTRIEVEREMLVDTATALKDVPGANVNRNGAITGIAQYRGMYGDRVAVGIDELGMITGGPNAMDAPLSYMSPMITEELVVERGIASVSKAPESIGGYVGTRLARGNFGDDRFGVSGVLGTRYGSNGNISTSVGRMTVANAAHRISFVTEIDSGDDVDSPAGTIRPSRMDRERYDLSYAFGNANGNLMVFAGRLDTTDTGTPALPMDIRYIETDILGLQFDRVLSDSVTVEGRLTWNDVEHLMDNFGLRGAPMPMQYRQNLATGSGAQFSLAGVIDVSESTLRLGIDGIRAEHDATITNPNMPMFRVDNFNAVDRNVTGIFAEWVREIDASRIEAGVRYKRVDTNAGTVAATGMPDPMGTNVGLLADAFNAANRDLSWNSADLVLKYQRRVTDATEWTVELGSKTRAPSYQELYLWLPLEATGGLADGRTYIGDLTLSEERSNEIVVGVTSDIGRFSFSPQLFYRDVSDYIQGVPSTNMLANMVSTMMTGAPALQFANVDAEIWGADLAWKYELTDRWSVDGIATWTRGRRTDVADNLYRLAPFNGSIGLAYTGTTWTVKPEVVIYANQDKVSAYNNEQPSDGYEIVNVAFAWDASDTLRVEVRIDNLLDETYQDHLAGINRAMGSDIPVGTRLYGAERTLGAGVMWRF